LTCAGKGYMLGVNLALVLLTYYGIMFFIPPRASYF
jgi:hypothetical protein